MENEGRLRELLVKMVPYAISLHGDISAKDDSWMIQCCAVLSEKSTTDYALFLHVE